MIKCHDCDDLQLFSSRLARQLLPDCISNNQQMLAIGLDKAFWKPSAAIKRLLLVVHHSLAYISAIKELGVEQLPTNEMIYIYQKGAAEIQYQLYVCYRTDPIKFFH